MNKTPKQVRKNLDIQEFYQKSHETYTKLLKEEIIRDNQLCTSSSIDNSSHSSFFSTDSSASSSSSSTNNFTARSSDSYIHAVGIMLFYPQVLVC